MWWDVRFWEWTEVRINIKGGKEDQAEMVIYILYPDWHLGPFYDDDERKLKYGDIRD